MKSMTRFGILVLAVLILTLPLLAACDDDDETKAPTGTPTVQPTDTATPSPTPVQKTKITIGLLTDNTGPASQALQPVDMALKDVIKYINDQNLIPTAEFKIESYDTAYDPSNIIPGYQWVKEKGADFVVSGVPIAAVIAKPNVDEDEMMFFSLTATTDMYTPPGWIFSVNIPTEAFIYTLMSWVQENDPNFPTDRPARIGGLGMEDPYVSGLLGGLEAYCAAHPDKWDWVDGFVVPWTQMTFPTETEALKDCDYIVPPSTGVWIANFMKEYTDTGYSTTFLGTDAQMAYWGFLLEAAGSDALDGMLFGLPYTWWNMDAEILNIAKEALTTYHSQSEQDELMWSGGSYRGGFTQWYGVMTIVKETIEAVGAENFDSQALYDTAVGFSENFDGNTWDYSDTERTSWNGLRIYRADGTAKDINQVSEGLVEVVFEP